MDVMVSEHFRDAVEMELEKGCSAVTIDGSRIDGLTAAGITALVDAVEACRERSLDLHVELSDEAQSVLDGVGLWWLTLPDAGTQSAGSALKDALRRYAELLEFRPQRASAPGSPIRPSIAR